MSKDMPLHQDINYLSGQIDGLRALLLALAQGVPKAFFREQGLLRLESARSILNAEPVADARIQAIDDMQRWLENVTN